MKYFLRASNMRTPPRLPASAAIVVEILSDVKEGKFGTRWIALFTGGFFRIEQSPSMHTEETFPAIWSGEPRDGELMR